MIRPRIASVVSVVWLYLGSAWVLIGALGLYGYYSMQGALDALGAHKAEVPTIYLWFPLLTLVFGAAGIVGARGLLKCKESGRKLLRGVSFGTVALLFAFTWSVALAVTNAGDRHYSPDVRWEQMKLAIAGIVVGGLTAIPFIIMGRKLGSAHLRVQMT